MPRAGRGLSAARHCCRGPPVSLSPPPLFSRQRAHGARRPRPPVLGRCPSVSRDPPCSCPASSTRRPRRPIPTDPLRSSSRRPPLKRAPHRRRPKFFPPRRDFPFSTPTPRRNQLPRLLREPQDRSAAHRSPLFPAAGHRLCVNAAAPTPHIEQPLG
jgi:hypothetical protein